MKMHTSPAAKDFSKAQRAALARQGIAIIGAAAIPDMSSSLPYANASRGYCLDDNGTHRVRSYQDVVDLAAA